MAQITFVDGDYPTAADLNTYCAGEGNAWTSWTPVLTQSGSVAVTNTRSVFARYGRTIHATFDLTVTGTGTASQPIQMTIPATAAASIDACGTMAMFDSSSGNSYRTIIRIPFTTAVRFAPMNSTSSSDLGVTQFSAALASGDTLSGTFTYEAAS